MSITVLLGIALALLAVGFAFRRWPERVTRGFMFLSRGLNTKEEGFSWWYGGYAFGEHQLEGLKVCVKGAGLALLSGGGFALFGAVLATVNG